MTEKAGKAPNHWPLLDFLRATAALLVLFAHSRALYFLNIDVVDHPGVFLKLFYFITDLGHQAVVIFFVLSGFLIGGSLTDSMQRGSFDLARYLIARFVRIYIVYLPALVITEGVFLFGSLLLSDPGDGYFRPLFSHQQMDFGGVSQAICFLAGLQGFSCPAWEQNVPLWSLGYEWALYLFAPAIIQLIVWKASPGLRLIALALVCAIAATVCHYPSEAVFWFIAWFLGAGSYRILRAGLVPLPAGLLGAGLIIAGMAVRHLKAAGELETDTIIAAGTAIVIACRPMAAFPLAPRLFGWAAGFSYTLYAIHLPLVFLIVAIFQNIGFPRDKVPPSPVAFMEFGVTSAICLLAAFLVSLVSERKTGQVRAAMLRMCPPRVDREVSDRG
ncbi:MAG: acyltransferase [Pseudomonadota bacterium]|nr:acyltransferase [Pseudomonadota bacterium]